MCRRLCDFVFSLLGTMMTEDAPLMSAGLDSIATEEFANVISRNLSANFSAMMLFDHPTLNSIASYLLETTIEAVTTAA